MAGITLAHAESQLAIWLAANEAVASGQSYTIGSRSLDRVNSKEILEQVEFWDGKVKELARGTTGMRIRGATPV